MILARDVVGSWRILDTSSRWGYKPLESEDVFSVAVAKDLSFTVRFVDAKSKEEKNLVGRLKLAAYGNYDDVTTGVFAKYRQRIEGQHATDAWMLTRDTGVEGRFLILTVDLENGRGDFTAFLIPENRKTRLLKEDRKELVDLWLAANNKADIGGKVYGWRLPAGVNEDAREEKRLKSVRPTQKSDRTKSHEQFVEEVKAINPTIEVSERYVTRRTPIKMRCKICYSEWMATPIETLRGRGCAQCRQYALERLEAEEWEPKTMEEAIGLRVKELRRENYLTTETLGLLMGFRTGDIVHRIERGESTAIINNLKKAQKALEVSEEEFFDSPLFNIKDGKAGNEANIIQSAVVKRGITSRKVYEAVGTRLRLLRTSRGIAASKLASDLEIDERSYKDYEHAGDHVSVATLARAASYYGMTLSEFFDSPLFDSLADKDDSGNPDCSTN